MEQEEAMPRGPAQGGGTGPPILVHITPFGRENRSLAVHRDQMWTAPGENQG